MRKLLLLALLMPLAAQAASWVSVGSNGESQSFIDKASILKTVDGYKAWSLTSYSKEQTSQDGSSYQSVKELHVYACKARTVTLLSQVYYSAPMGKGPVAQNIKYEKFSAEDIIPDSTDDSALQVVCKGGKSK
ncbi:MAG: surface-adhesin E family protein [Massilia sp.]